MPCDSGPAHSDYDRLQRELDRVTRLLCELCTMVLGMQLHGPLKAHATFSTELEAWFIEHKRTDAARRHREEQQQQQEALRKQALAKLTEEERSVLSLK